MVSGACDDLQHTAGSISVLEEGCGAIPVELPGSQNLLWTGCSCTGYGCSPLQYSQCILTMPAASCLRRLLAGDVAYWLALAAPTTAYRRQEGFTSYEAELRCIEVYFCMQCMLVNDFA